MRANLLVELFTEELPPKALKRLGDAFAAGVFEGLRAAGLPDATSKARAFATPRRLAVSISAVLDKAPDRPVEHKLMPLAVARSPDGAWSEALRRKLAGMGREQLADVPVNTRIGPDSLGIKADGKAESVVLRSIAPGQSLERALQDAVKDAIEKLPIPKVMGYQLADGATTVKFVRPAHGLVALHGDRVIGISVLGLQAGRITHGHRFQGAGEITLNRADEYQALLEDPGKVIADFDQRKADIARQLAHQASGLGASLGPQADVAPLLDEVTALVEYPTVYVGEFEAAFLGVPQECLILTMRQNQKYFPLFDAAGRLTNKFLIVSNMRLDDPKNIVEGNQRVVRPRLADARFFFDTDRKTKLADRIPQLESIVYHNKLGTQLQRVQRLKKLAGHIAGQLHSDVSQAERAGLLAKADLVTGMVGEFPELQGIMGRCYALHDGEPAPVADAIEQHYRPRFANDVLPADNIGAAAALADKLDTLIGIFGIRLIPTGDKDPFALRRHALGILRILAEKQLPLDLLALLQEAKNQFPKEMLADSVVADVHAFMLDRLRSWLKDRDFAVDEIEAVVSQNPVRIDLVLPRLEAVRAFRKLPDAESLASANKRIRNILRKTEAVKVEPDLALMQEGAEKRLFGAVTKLMPEVHSLVANEGYTEALQLLAGVRKEVDSFFDEVMVMTEDPLTRDNRLALLSQLERLMNQVADISKLAA